MKWIAVLMFAVFAIGCCDNDGLADPPDWCIEMCEDAEECDPSGNCIDFCTYRFDELRNELECMATCDWWEDCSEYYDCTHACWL
jgi:hypothetical protein